MIKTFTPSAGRLAGQPFSLPTYAQDERTQRHQSVLQTLPLQNGAYSSAGSGMEPLDYGTIALTFDITPAFLVTNGNGRNYYNGTHSDNVGLMNAILHFTCAVAEGGQGTLTDTLEAGIIDPATGAAITSMTCSAIVEGEMQITKTYSHAAIQVTWAITSGGWTLQPTGVFVALC